MCGCWSSHLALQRVSVAQRGLQLILKIRVHANNMGPALSCATTAAIAMRTAFLLALVLEGNFHLGAVALDFPVLQHHVELGNLRDAQIAQGLRGFFYGG